MYKNKNQILDDFFELGLSKYGDFIVKKEFLSNYDIIDFHTHIFESVSGNIPSLFRKKKYNNISFFDYSPYPGGIYNLDLNEIEYRKWPANLLSKEGILAIWYNMGLPAFKIARNATLERMNDDMAELSINQSVILPINTVKYDNTEDLIKLTKNNKKHIIFGSIHPYEERIDEKIEHYLKNSIKGFKINPHIMQVNIDDAKMIKLLKVLSKTKLPIISCSGYQLPEKIKNVPKSIIKQLSTQRIKKFQKVLNEIDPQIFIFAHGGLYEYLDVIKIMKDFPFTYVDISTQNKNTIKIFIDEIGSKRILFGSDYPYLSPAFTILSVLHATKNESERKTIFSENAKRILKC